MSESRLIYEDCFIKYELLIKRFI